MDWIKGTGVALVTPFTNEGQVDYPALAKLIEHGIQGGLSYVVALGTTGETVTLTQDEQHSILDFVVKTVAGRIAVVAGFGGNNTTAVIQTIQAYHFNGIEAILSASPAYNKPTQEGIYQHYKAIESIAPKPIILYNVPGRTGKNMTAETTLRLANSSAKFIAIKEASGDLAQCMEIVKGKPKHFTLISGDDNLTLPMMSIGCEGVISVVAQAFPKIYSEMVQAALANDFQTAKKLHYKLMDLTDLLFIEGNPGGIKAALHHIGIGEESLRLPLVPVSDVTRQAIIEQITLIKHT